MRSRCSAVASSFRYGNLNHLRNVGYDAITDSARRTSAENASKSTRGLVPMRVRVVGEQVASLAPKCEASLTVRVVDPLAGDERGHVQPCRPQCGKDRAFLASGSKRGVSALASKSSMVIAIQVEVRRAQV